MANWRLANPFRVVTRMHIYHSVQTVQCNIILLCEFFFDRNFTRQLSLFTAHNVHTLYVEQNYHNYTYKDDFFFYLDVSLREIVFTNNIE